MTHEDQTPETAALLACTVSHDVQDFDLLIEDMESALGESWGDLTFEDTLAFLEQPEAETLEFLAIAINEDDEDAIVMIENIVLWARSKNIRVILVTENVTPSLIHQLLRAGADEFLPYPLPEGELERAIARVRTPDPEPASVEEPAQIAAAPAVAPARVATNGIVLAAQGLSGGSGTTTLAVNLAWELANMKADKAPRVALLDFNIQFGSVATYLDLQPRDAVHELLSDVQSMDDDAFCSSLVQYKDKLNVLTSPPDILPMEFLTAEDVEALIETARRNFDYVVIDMPSVLTGWTDAVLQNAHVFFAMLELDMRSAQNSLRLKRLLQAEDLPIEKLRYVLNRAPKFTDLSGRARVKRLAEGLDISIELQMPDGGKQVSQACDHGAPLSESATKNPLRKEIVKLAQQVHDLNHTAEEAA